MSLSKPQILFVSPKRSLWAKNIKITNFFLENKEFLMPWYSFPLSILTIAAATLHDYYIDFIVEDFESIDFNKKYDIVAISAMTQQIIRAYEIADTFKKNSSKIVLGGIHASVLSDEALEHVDSVILGEGETLWIEFLKDFLAGNIKQKYDNNSYFDLSKSPIPRYDLIKPEYIKKNQYFFNMIPTQATRGCPHDCSFCLVYKIYGKKIRKKNIQQILDEVTNIKNIFGHQLILFVDDNFFVDKEFTKNLLKELIKLRINWVAQSDIFIVNDQELLKLSYLSGCLMLLIGFESLNEDSLESINNNHWKMKQFKKYSEAVNIIQQNGIIVHAAFVVGFDNDDISIFKKLRDFCIINHCQAQFTILTLKMTNNKQFIFLKIF